ncbi:DUF4240 domain-containing protein [uncultured Tenacibaculum sp.]|uniref:DUF4240 domain-containing protein n=1 Tax=uncultured Tenacibaculum sp. TaxID=174713 RepID=UPI002626A450|nr:DUF4240 domain-containing protein [uncultured Tenacibaculum sp.]
MNHLINTGKKRTILISISILLISIHTIYFYHSVRPEIEVKKLISQLVRFSLTLGLLIMVHKGKSWAKNISLVLFSIAVLIASVSFFTINAPILNKTPLIVMIFIYSMAIHHFGFSSSYKAFFDFQNSGTRSFSTEQTIISEKIENTNVETVISSYDSIMETNKFWNIIETTKNKSLGDYEQQQIELEKELYKLTANEVLEFDNKFRTLRGNIYNWDFWAAAYIINGGCSDDCFLDFRGWLIGQGKSVFENAIINIKSLTELKDTNDGDWEGLSYIATSIYEEKTGKEMPTGISENFNMTGEEWDEDSDDLKNRYPKLWAKFGME